MLYAAKLQNLWENIIISFDFFTILIKELPNGRSKLSKFDLNRSEKLGCINEFLLLQLKMSNSAFMSVCIVDDRRQMRSLFRNHTTNRQHHRGREHALYEARILRLNKLEIKKEKGEKFEYPRKSDIHRIWTQSQSIT